MTNTSKAKQNKKANPLAELQGRVRFLEIESEQWNRLWSSVLDWATVGAVILAAIFFIWSARA
jgi:uncharacterized protein (DUF2062 family)